MGPRWKGKGAEAEAKALTNPMSQIVSQLKSSLIRSSACELLAGCCVLVAIEEELSDLFNQSCFGRPFITAKSDKQWFQLGMEEGFCLRYSLKCLTIQDKSSNPKSFEDVWRYMTNEKTSFPESFRAYCHLRTKNWVVRPGSQYSVDFVTYRYHPTLVYSDYAVLVLNDGDANDNGRLRVWSDFHCSVRLCGRMVFFFWTRPSTQDQMICIDKAGPLNYEAKYKGATANSAPTLKEDRELLKDGFFTNHARVLVGSGIETYERGKTALQNWRHFGLNWAFVDSTTRIQNSERFCVCTKEFVPWFVMPLEVLYVTESRNKKNCIALYQFGSGTLGGHLLAGEERFSIELDTNNQVWYEILSFSKPAHFLSFIAYPYVQLKQKLFANHSGNAVLNYLKAP